MRTARMGVFGWLTTVRSSQVYIQRSCKVYIHLSRGLPDSVTIEQRAGTVRAVRLTSASVLLSLAIALSACGGTEPEAPTGAAPAPAVTTDATAASNAASALGYESFEEWRSDADSTYPGFEGVVDFTGGTLTVLSATPAGRDPAAYGQLVAASIAYQLSLQNLEAQLSGTSRASFPIDAIVVLDPSGLKLAERTIE